MRDSLCPQFLHLDALLPSWLSAVVPNLNQLALHGCVIILKDSAAEQLEAAPCTSRITKLTLGPQIVPALNSHGKQASLDSLTGQCACANHYSGQSWLQRAVL